MLSVIDVIKSLTLMIENKFPDYPVNDRDITEGFERPSYFIDVEEVRGSNVTAQYTKESADIMIAFFAEDIYKGFLNLLEVKNTLLDLLNQPLALTDANGKTVAHVVFDDVNVSISKPDKALTATMSYELIQQREVTETGYTILSVDLDVSVN